ncbi:L-selectin-like [Diabrotica virgifera virgifera]|uniref:C-type lectin domain-containing protein n=1 Tax=Diabrotica virgifera virgifera TaxID=50390 RepID=A0ABM5IKU1_DIAVI|nr:L-selectin-like [Diabrotica virgifera virgifera]
MLLHIFLLTIIINLIESDGDTKQAIAFTSRFLIRRNDSNFLEYGGSRYHFNTDFEGNFFAAYQFCKSRNMDLVSIETEAENDRIQQYLIEKGLPSPYSIQFWTSAANTLQGGKWMWLATGKEVKYFNWGFGEPLFVPNFENCIVVRLGKEHGVTWHDLNCLLPGYAICEYPLSCTCSLSKVY